MGKYAEVFDMAKLKDVFDLTLSDDDVKRVRATIGLLIAIVVWIAFFALGIWLYYYAVIDPILLIVVLIGLGDIYGGICILIQILFKTKPEEIPQEPTLPVNQPKPIPPKPP